MAEPTRPILDLGGATAIVTGAGQGVGRAIALYFAAHNAGGVVVNDFYLDRAEAVADEVRSAGCKAFAVAADVGDYEAVKRMVAEGAATLGPVRVLVNNAGNAGPGVLPTTLPSFWDTEPEDWDKWLRPNLVGVLNCCRAAVPGMIEAGGGRIVSVISDAGRVGEAQYAVYSAAKAGAAGFMRALAKGVGRHGITANCVSLSAVSTPGLEARLSDPDRRKKVLSNYVVRRLGQPEDAAAMVLFLCSGAASWITGQTYPVNGGYSFAV